MKAILKKLQRYSVKPCKVDGKYKNAIAQDKEGEFVKFNELEQLVELEENFNVIDKMRKKQNDCLRVAFDEAIEQQKLKQENQKIKQFSFEKWAINNGYGKVKTSMQAQIMILDFEYHVNTSLGFSFDSIRTSRIIERLLNDIEDGHLAYLPGKTVITQEVFYAIVGKASKNISKWGWLRYVDYMEVWRRRIGKQNIFESNKITAS